MSRRRGWWVNTYDKLLEGDVIMKPGGPTLLVKRYRVKRPGKWSHSKPQYFWEGTFLNLETGDIHRARLGTGAIIDPIVWAPRQP